MKLYKISIDEGKRKKIAEACLLSNTTSEEINCSVCNTKWVKGIFERPLEIIFTNNNLPDYTAILPEKFISEKLKEVIEHYSLSDMTFEEAVSRNLNELNDNQIKMFKLDGMKVNKFCSIPSRYYAINIAKGISVHPDMSIQIHKCENCGRQSFKKLKQETSMLLTYILDYSTWNGKDLFTVEGFPLVYICTERFVDICKNENITGISFDEVEVRK